MLTEAERLRLEKAIRQAETGTAGEIVVVLARRAASYRSVPLLYGLLAALLVPWPLLWLTSLGTVRLLIVQLLAALIVVLITAPAGIRHRLVPARLRRRRAREAAQRAFLNLGLMRTRGRTGVLLYLSDAERHAEVIGDSTIAAQIDEAEWRAIIDELIAGIGRDGTAVGLLAAIAGVGTLLSRHVPAGPNNPDELPNRVLVI